MRTRHVSFAAAVLATAASLFATTPAHAAPDPSGLLCWMYAPDVGGTSSGVVTAGPVLLGDDTDPARLYTGSVTCSVKTSGGLHTSPDAAVVTGSESTGVAWTAGRVTFPTGTYGEAWVCTRADLADGSTLYYDDWDGEWTTSVYAACADAYTDLEGQDCTLGVGTCGCDEECIDSLVCPVFAEAFPPEGDITLPDPVGTIWDCPPYQFPRGNAPGGT